MSLAIALIHFTAPPVVGGVESVLGHHARLMADAGHAVRVVVGRGGGFDRRVELRRIPLADARNAAIRGVQRDLARGVVSDAYAAVVTALERDLRRATEDVDLIIAHNVCSLSMNVALTAALHRLVMDRGTPPLIAWQHDIAAASKRHCDELYDGHPWDLFRRPWPRVLQVTISEARRIELAHATGVPGSSIRVIPNGIHRDEFLSLVPATRRILDTLDLHGSGPILLTPARVTPRKNLQLAVAVIGELRRSGADARLIITGAPDAHDPRSRRYLDALRVLATAAGVAPGVHLLVDGPPAWRSAGVVADLFRIADALFLPSLDEGFGLPILEAAITRLPVICADTASLRELAGSDATYFDPRGDPAEVAEIVRRRLDADPVHHLAVRTRTSFSWKTIFSAQIEPLLLEAVAGAGAAPR